MATWEFTSEHSSSYDIDGLIQKLNERAEDGWELVSIIPTGGDVTAFFKREKATEKEAAGAAGKEAVPVAGGLGSLAAVSAADRDETVEKEKEAEGEKPLSAVGASAGAPGTSLVEETREAAAFRPEEPAKEPAGWAIAPETAAAGATAGSSTGTVTSTGPGAGGPSGPSSATSAPAPSSPGTTPGMAPIGGTTTPAGGAAGVAGVGGAAASAPAPAPAAPTPAPAPVVTTPAGWYPDPSGRYEMRYWDGQQWTEYVSRAGQQYTDPPVA